MMFSRSASLDCYSIFRFQFNVFPKLIERNILFLAANYKAPEEVFQVGHSLPRTERTRFFSIIKKTLSSICDDFQFTEINMTFAFLI